jgi:hypothetical protein
VVADHGRRLSVGRRRVLEPAAYALQFGIFISLFTLIWDFFALLFGSSYEAETIPWLLAGAVYLYLSYPGVQRPFLENEMNKVTPEQRAAMEQMAAATPQPLRHPGSRPRSPDRLAHRSQKRLPWGEPLLIYRAADSGSLFRRAQLPVPIRALPRCASSSVDHWCTVIEPKRPEFSSFGPAAK